jgi:hypothetical protein
VEFRLHLLRLSLSFEYMASKQKKRETMKLKALEDGFNLTNMNRAKVPEYNALYDPNMRHFFENRNVQRLLYSSGQIDKHGRVINLDKNKSKIFILEREFREAEKVEERRMQEEMEMRVRNNITFQVTFNLCRALTKECYHCISIESRGNVSKSLNA